LHCGTALATLPTMNRSEKSRWRNILKKAAKVNFLLKKGYVVFDHFDTKVKEFKFCKKENYLYQGNNQCKIVWAGKKGIMWNHALDFSIKKYNATYFDKWKAVHPKNIKKI
jgi:hypothetical protein